jgi:phenylalanyl-tRNA synthetase beta chain
MRASYNWLRALLPGLEATAAEVAERLTACGLEVEGISRFGEGLEPVVVARVVAIEPHPSKSGLRLVTVDRGGSSERGEEAEQRQRVVCGAPNVPEPGGLVVLAPLGATLPAVGMTIEPRAIGGVVSEGMLCSEVELGIGAGGEGIMILDAGTPGQRFLEAVPSASDVIYEINVTPNRPDALGHLGIARDLAALYGLPFGRGADAPASGGAAGPGEAAIRLTLDDRERCPHYGAAILEGVTVGPSPRWVQHRLFSLGIRPVSNLVDVTNLLLLERGQPMHAFDLDRVGGGEIRIRRARSGERLETLDGKERRLVEDDLVIADAQAPLALAGVMGGAGSEVSAATTRVLLECAYFEPRGVRRASRRHGLHTEASHRFERGVDPGGVRASLGRALALALELSPGARVAGESHALGAAPRQVEVLLRGNRLDALLGVKVPFGEAAGILERLGCEELARSSEPPALRVRVPSFRPDLTREADLIEEVARIRGLEAIPASLPPIVPQAPRATGELEGRLRRAAVELGLTEAVTYAFVSPRELEALSAPVAVVKLSNPLTEERSVMRTTLLPGLLEALARARRHGERGARLFTVGKAFLAPDAGESLPFEQRGLAVVMAGPRPAYLAKAEEHDVFDAKATALELVERATRRRASVRAAEGPQRPAHLHPRGAAQVLVDGRLAGHFGPLHPDVIERLDLGGGAVVIELDLEALEGVGRRTPQAAHVPKLPAVTRDLAFEVDDALPAGTIEQMIREAAGELCEQVEVFDLFRGGNLPAGRKSLAFHIVYRDPRDAAGEAGARTLTDAEVDQRNQQVKAAVLDRLGGQLRG